MPGIAHCIQVTLNDCIVHSGTDSSVVCHSIHHSAAPMGLLLTPPATRDELPLDGSAHVRVSGGARAFPPAVPATPATRTKARRPASNEAAPSVIAPNEPVMPGLAPGQRETSFSGMAFEGASPGQFTSQQGRAIPHVSPNRQPQTHVVLRQQIDMLPRRVPNRDSRVVDCEALLLFHPGRWKAAMAT